MACNAEAKKQKDKFAIGGGTAESAIATKLTKKKNVEGGGATISAARSPERILKPRIFKLGKKELEIAKGEKRRRGEYPTFDDVKSDWDSNADKDEDKTKSKVETKLEESEQGDDKEKNAKKKENDTAINKDEAEKQSEQKKPSAPPAGDEDVNKKKESSKKSTPELKVDKKEEAKK